MCQWLFFQVCETAIDLSLDEFQVQKVSYGHVIDGAIRSNYLHGTEYEVDLSFQAKETRRKENVVGVKYS